jgi:hypothetical protein
MLFFCVLPAAAAELVQLHEVPHPTQPGSRPPRRLNRYHELTQHAWGEAASSNSSTITSSSSNFEMLQI